MTLFEPSEPMDQRPPTCRITKYGPLSPDEAEAFEEMAGAPMTLTRGQYVRHRGDTDPKVYFLRSGWVSCSVTFEDGARQIVKIHLPGDLVGVPSFAASVAGETIQALSDAVVAPVSNQSFGRLFRHHPRLAAILFVVSQEERALLMRRLAWVGRTRSIQRVGELIMSLHDRVSLADPTHTGPIFAPLSQEEIGDATGLTNVTVNHCLQELRQRQVASWRRFSLEVHDRARLEELVGIPREAIRTLDWFEDPMTDESRPPLARSPTTMP
ncbi:Crp/Fnr family transcriptional regulator [Aureimonas sp. SK2]|uniref:Crp/Fnr family transcriptional regulator n=1 Tax=Aureimonas sp. SK2 TaxID=3015992 RepID=UPI002444F95F|nr:Crp/Fnr family transcriptional regulator [Aureimonas sp. SK2]